jgi:3'-5' exoribonuclease
VVRYALALTEVSDSRANIDRDLVVIGGLFHDIGKVKTYTTEAFEFDYSDDGYLEEHISIGARLIDLEISSIEGFPEETRRKLIHIVLSHHGEVQFGSPVTPKTRESIIIWLCDNLDSRLDNFETHALMTSNESKWTDFSKMFQSRLYLGERKKCD